MVRTVVLLVTALLIALLALLNWSTLATPTLISLGLTSVNAPLGLIMLGLTVVLAIFFVAYVLAMQGTLLVDTRRHARELQVQRDLAEKAEVSRFTDLRSALDARMLQQAQDANAVRDALMVRIDRLEQSLNTRLEQSDNSTAAHVGQLEDRVMRGAGPGASF